MTSSFFSVGEQPNLQLSPEFSYNRKATATTYGSDGENTERRRSSSCCDQETVVETSCSMDDDDSLSDVHIVKDPFNIHEKLGVVPLAVIIFYGVSGGAFGVEETVRSAGNFYTLLGFLVMPCIWSLQEALMTAELGSALPEASGGVAWVQEAFGDCAGWMAGYLGWVSGATDNAIYPVLFVEYLLQFVHGSNTTDDDEEEEVIPPWLRFALFSSISVALAYTNWLGLPLVGKMSLAICLIAISPFVILCVVGAFQVDPARWFSPPMPLAVEGHDNDSQSADLTTGLFSLAAVGNIAWRPYLNNLFWNLNSFDNAATYSADVEDPGRVLPRALAMSVLMVSLCYFLPLLITLGASNAPQAEWVDGYFSVAAVDIAGPWLGAWLVFAAGISNIAMFQAELSSDAFKLLGMAERGYLPSVFAMRSRHGTPTYGIVVGTVVIVAMSVTNLDQLIEMLNFNYAVALGMEYLSFLKLRVSRPDLHRPFSVPLGTIGCTLLFTPTLLAIAAVLALASVETLLFNMVVMIVGLLLFSLRRRQNVQYSQLGRV